MEETNWKVTCLSWFDPSRARLSMLRMVCICGSKLRMGSFAFMSHALWTMWVTSVTRDW